MSRPLSVLVSAGEPSGDRCAAPVVSALRALRPELRFFGAGGDALRSAGLELRHHSDQLAVTGFSESLARLPAAIRLVSDMWLQIRRRKPVLALLVDFPGLNLRLAGMCRRAGVPVLYFVAPQRWAWLAGRTAALGRQVNRLAVVLPFEEAWFQARGVAATFVGHPVVDQLRLPSRTVARRSLHASADRPVVAIFPGSRAHEVKRHLPLVVQAVAALGRVTPVLAVIGGWHEQLCRQYAPGWPTTSTAVALAAADAALCTSGTATLEAAVACVPTVVFYRTSAVSFALARRLARLSMVALPNLLAGRMVFPELLQNEMTAEALAAEARRLLRRPAAEAVRRQLRGVCATLGDVGVAQRVARLALPLLPPSPTAMGRPQPSAYSVAISRRTISRSRRDPPPSR